MRLDGLIEAGLLATALQQLQQRHPKLRAAIAEGADGRLRYQFPQTVPPIPFEIADYYQGETHWREAARRLLDTELPASGPLARASVLRNRSSGQCELLLSLPHSITDGVSCIMLMDDLLAGYARAEGNADLPGGPGLPIVTPSWAKESGGWRSRWRLLRRVARLMRDERTAPLVPVPQGCGVPPLSQWVHWVFSRQDTIALVRRCRQERSSLNGALLAAACCGLIDCLPAADGLVKWQMPFSLREALEGPAGPVTAQDLGCFVANMNGLSRITPHSRFWDLAREAHREVQAFTDRGGPSFGYNASAGIYGMKVRLMRTLSLRTPRIAPPSLRPTLFATNYGVVNIRESYGSLRPQECTLIFKNELSGPLLVLEALVMGQRLNIGFAGSALDPAFWERLQPAVRRQLEAAMGAGE